MLIALALAETLLFLGVAFVWGEAVAGESPETAGYLARHQRAQASGSRPHLVSVLHKVGTRQCSRRFQESSGETRLKGRAGHVRRVV